MATTSIPTTLKVLPLPRAQTLFPGLVISISLHQRSSVGLLRSVIRDVENGAPNQPAIIAVAPLRVEGDPNGRGLKIVDPDDESSKSLQVIKIPRESDVNNGEKKPSADDIYDWACAARIVRIERMSTGGYVVVVEGLARVRIERFTAVGWPWFEANVIAFNELPLPAPAQPKLLELKQLGNALFDTYQEMQLSIPPAIARRLKGFVASASLASAGSLADALVSTLATAHADKLALLAVTNPEERVALAIEILSKTNEEVGTTKRIGERVNDNMSRRQRAYFLQQQLEAIAQELRDLDAKSNGGKPSTNGPSSLGGLLGGGGDQEEQDELGQLEKQIDAAAMPAEAYQSATRELKRLRRIPPQSMEHSIIRNYLDWMVALPWGRSGATAELDRAFLDRARKQLDDDHYGLDKVKKRLLEYLAVLRLKAELDRAERAQEMATRGDDKVLRDTLSGKDADVKSPLAIEPVRDEQDSDASAYSNALDKPRAVAPVEKKPSPSADKDVPRAGRHKGPILLLVGPPGVGKTSIARSLATAMGRKFHRISLGGVRDEAEIRGHRRTYVGAMPGLIAQALRKVGTNDPVILLDEIDKISSNNFHGDPAAAMLEVLDPEQNWNFNDHYIGVGMDLSQVLFVATANTLETISPPLMDRMEVIQLSGYVFDEKAAIGRKYLLPKQLEANALTAAQVELPDESLMHIVTHYTMEAGVRTLERQIGAVCRGKAVEYAEARDAVIDSTPRLSDAESAAPAPGDLPTLPKGYEPRVDLADIERLLGPATNEPDPRDLQTRVGVAAGLAYRSSGNGGLLYVEATSFPIAGAGKLRTSGSLGDVISESAQLALTWVRSHAYDLALSDSVDEDVMRGKEIHLHLPSGAIKKDGPSAGVAFVVCLVSLLSGLCVREAVAMTGEISLRGQVLPVGGIREKVLAASRIGIKTIILPLRNQKDVIADVPQAVKDQVTFVFASTIYEALEAAFGEGLAPRTTQQRTIVDPTAERVRRRRAETVQSRL